MPKAPDFDELIRPLAQLIARFLTDEFNYTEFQRQFQPALKSYQRSVSDRAYWPLDVIADIPKHCKSKLREYCQQALDRLPKEALDRSTRVWIESTLVAGDHDYTHFSFFDERGHSHLGTHAAIYSTPIEKDSFLLSALHGKIVPPPFRYSKLLATLRDLGGNELATWVYGTEPDNAFASVERVWSLGDAYKEPDQLLQIERRPSPEGGGSYLMLLPKSKRWLLLNEYNGVRFTICLHGSREFIIDVAARIKAEPVWAWRADDA